MKSLSTDCNILCNLSSCLTGCQEVLSPSPILIYTHGLYTHSSTDAINTNPFMTVYTEDLRLDVLWIKEAKEQQSSAKARREVTSAS